MSVLARLFALVLACTACVSGSGTNAVAPEDLDDIARASGLAAREFETTRDLFGTNVRIVGIARDAYRYAGTVFLAGRPLFEEVVIDDARYVRLLAPELVRAAAAEGTALGGPLLGGGWVVDPGGAPPEFGEGSTVEEPDPVVVATSPTLALDLLAPATLLREVRFFDQAPALLRTGERVRAWNTDAADYLESRDLFPPHPEDGTRFDALPKGFDPGVAVSGLASLEQFFRTSAIWVRDGRVSRFETLFAFPDPADPRYQAALRTFRPQADPANPATAELAQRGADVLRALGNLHLSESRTFRPPPGGADVRAPEGAAEVDLAAALATLKGTAPATSAAVAPDLAGLLGEDGP